MFGAHDNDNNGTSVDDVVDDDSENLNTVEIIP